VLYPAWVWSSNVPIASGSALQRFSLVQFWRHPDTAVGSILRGYPSPCYENMLCGQSVVCRKGTDGGVDAGAAAAPRCGDGIVQAGEECDCGHGIVPVPAGCIEPNNDNTYGGCTTGCTWGPRCGDGVVQMNNGEQCDLGSQNGVFQNGLGICTLYCEWIPWLP